MVVLRYEAYERSDLACESCAGNFSGIAGSVFSEREVGDIHITRLNIRTEEASHKIQKPIGTYLTLECGRFDRMNLETREMLCHILAGEIRGMALRLGAKLSPVDLNVLVAGLGNAELTADAIGPKTVGQLTVTRHLRTYEKELFESADCASLSAIAPGVLGQTGIETLEVLRGAVRYVHPDVVLVVDALAARSCERLASTVQLSDVGITPGSGVGNHRAAIDKETLGVPVIAIGIPTVVHSATLVYDALQEAGIDKIDDRLHHVLESGRSFFVSPKESDLISAHGAGMLAKAIELSFGGALSEYGL